jgi:phenylacetate-coenzyme A ligase PaaK-like adenylate-forming protein
LQYDQNEIYRSYVDELGIDISGVKRIENIPFLPISFFKSHKIATTDFEPAIIFESSGTTGENTSSHFVKDLSVYKRSFLKAFRLFYGDPANWCIIALLPGYLDRQHSSLVYMTDELIKMSNHPYSGFYLDDFDKLYQSIVHNEIRDQPVLLIGVTFALMDFAEKYFLQLKNTTVMETGGMKGRRTEIIREEVHDFLKNKLGVQHIHSEYGMTELLSQAYSPEKGIFQCPPWMNVMVREENDPFEITSGPVIQNSSTGLINIIDFANLYSCSFIATDDIGRLYSNGNFEVLGRRDMSDLRGCSLLTSGN